MPTRIFTFVSSDPFLRISTNCQDSTRGTIATVVALAGLGVAALNLNSKAEAAKKAQAAVGTTSQSFALGGCERSGELFSWIVFEPTPSLTSLIFLLCWRRWCLTDATESMYISRMPQHSN
jgi:hypothetical protein